MASLTVAGIRELLGPTLTDEQAQALLDWYAALAASVARFPYADLKTDEPPLRSTPGPQ